MLRKEVSDCINVVFVLHFCAYWWRWVEIIIILYNCAYESNIKFIKCYAVNSEFFLAKFILINENDTWNDNVYCQQQQEEKYFQINNYENFQFCISLTF